LVKTLEKQNSPSAEDRLINVFAQLFSGCGTKEETYYPLCSLSLDHIYPRETKEGSYENLIADFEKELIGLDIADPYFLEKLYFLLFKYTWAVPAQTQKAGFKPDISLFAHLKLTAALGICLLGAEIDYHKTLTKLRACWHKERRKFLAAVDKEDYFNHPVATLLLGDLSGIQSFIFNIPSPSKGAAKSLKGRSLYLEILLYVIARYVLRELNLPIINMLYIGGGNFYLLVPPNKHKELERLQTEIEKVLFAAHKGQIWVGLAWEDLNIKDLLIAKRLARKFGKDVHDKMQLRKYRKFANEDVFKPFSSPKTFKRCELCGREDVREEEEVKICHFCDSLRKLTRDLKEARYFYLQEKQKEERRDYKSYQDVFSAFGYKAGFCKKKLEKDVQYYLINEIPQKLEANQVGFIFLPVSLPLDKEGQILSFEELVEKGPGARQLGVLKIDLDNLGFILGKGWEEWTKKDFDTECKDEERESSLSLSRIAFLSTMLSLFFNWQVPKLAAKEAYKDSVYLIFSGGDDVFAVGAWEKVLSFLKEVREKFEQFTQNKLITFSSSYLVVPTHFPVIRFAHLAEERLSEAKKREELKKCPPPKNKGVFLDICLPWGFKEDESLETSVWQLYAWMERIEREIERKELAPFCRRLGLSAGIFAGGLRAIRRGKINLKYVWQFAYALRDWANKPKYQQLINELVAFNQHLVVKACRALLKEDKHEWLAVHPDFIRLMARLLNLKYRG
jgi:CRISPR-associated protein Csm1